MMPYYSERANWLAETHVQWVAFLNAWIVGDPPIIACGLCTGKWEANWATEAVAS